MNDLHMDGPFLLDAAEIDRIVTRTSAGNYAIGIGYGDDFLVEYIGRSDIDVNSRLKDWIGRCSHFMFSYATSPMAAFQKECQNYHDVHPMCNDIHPARPKGTSWECPVEGCTELK